MQRSPNDGIVNGPLQKVSLTILLSMSIFLVRKRKSLTAVFCQSVHILCNLGDTIPKHDIENCCS